MAGSPNLASRAWVTDQYDRYVRGNTALAQPDDAGVIRVDEESGLGVALATDANGRYCALDPYHGAQLALAEAYRNVATSGAKPLAVTDCLNFGSPEDPGVMWQFERAVTGLADACVELGVPVTGGNVSFYNQTGNVAIHPTPVVGVLGVLPDVARRTPSGWRAEGRAVYLLGVTRDEFGGSEWAWAEHGHLGGLPPAVDLDTERELAALPIESAEDGLLHAAHDLSDGGLAQALAEAALRFGVGARVDLAGVLERDGIDAFTALFAESTARVLVAVEAGQEVGFEAACVAKAFPHLRLGTTGGPSLDVSLGEEGRFGLPLEELRTAHESTLPSVFDEH
jgi:phosphoribosylformylglycinamidine synthase